MAPPPPVDNGVDTAAAAEWQARVAVQRDDLRLMRELTEQQLVANQELEQLLARSAVLRAAAATVRDRARRLPTGDATLGVDTASAAGGVASPAPRPVEPPLTITVVRLFWVSFIFAIVDSSYIHVALHISSHGHTGTHKSDIGNAVRPLVLLVVAVLRGPPPMDTSRHSTEG